MTQKSAGIQGVLFDLDGVLINSMPVMRIAFEASLRDIYPANDFDFDTIFDEYCRYLGMSFPEIMVRMNLSQDLFEPFKRHSRDLAGYVFLYTDIMTMLNWCREQNLVLGIATGKDYSRTQELLLLLNIDRYFTTVLASDKVAQPKPAPEMVHLFCKENAIEETKVVFVGDAPADICCGLAAGCITAFAEWGYGDKGAIESLNPDFYLQSPLDAVAQFSLLIDRKKPLP